MNNLLIDPTHVLLIVGAFFAIGLVQYFFPKVAMLFVAIIIAVCVATMVLSTAEHGKDEAIKGGTELVEKQVNKALNGGGADFLK
jgi:Flp pilus assembly protein TadB